MEERSNLGRAQVNRILNTHLNRVLLPNGALSSQGIGKALMQDALQKAKLKGLTRIELTVREKNERASHYSITRLCQKDSKNTKIGS